MESIFHSPAKIKAADSSSEVVIGMNHFINALKTSRPSLSDAERSRFKQIYDDFAGGRVVGSIGQKTSFG